VYTIWSILFIVFIILIIVTAFITIALTYFQLAVEDHRWWWRSFLCGGATGQLLHARFTHWCYSAMPALSVSDVSCDGILHVVLSRCAS
jgi:Endomembrane protein 70